MKIIQHGYFLTPQLCGSAMAAVLGKAEDAALKSRTWIEEQNEERAGAWAAQAAHWAAVYRALDEAPSAKREIESFETAGVQVMTCGEFKQWLATQPDDKQIQFTIVENDGTVQHLAVAEAYPAAHNYYVELEPVEVCHA